MPDTIGPAVARAKGIDVGHMDGAISWARVIAAGISFAFCKATEGTGFVDPLLKANWQGMGQAGITRGAYLFFNPAQDGPTQASCWLSAMAHAGGLLPTDLPPVLDIEQTDGQTPDHILGAAMKCLATLEVHTGKKPIVYVSQSFCDENHLGLLLRDHPLWIASYTNAPGPHLPFDAHGVPVRDWALWQYAAGEDGGHNVPGVPVSVDVNWYNGSHEQMVERFGLKG